MYLVSSRNIFGVIESGENTSSFKVVSYSVSSPLHLGKVLQGASMGDAMHLFQGWPDQGWWLCFQY